MRSSRRDGKRSYLTCRHQRATWNRPCGTTLAIVDFEVRFTGRVLRDTRDGETGMLTVWCQRCKRATEYEVTAPETSR